MRTIIIWQTTRGPVLVDKDSSERIENCKQIDIAPIIPRKFVEATLHLWPDDVAGTIQHGLEPTLERVHVEFAPLFPSAAQTFDGDGGKTAKDCANKFEDALGRHFEHPPESGEVT